MASPRSPLTRGDIGGWSHVQRPGKQRRHHTGGPRRHQDCRHSVRSGTFGSSTASVRESRFTGGIVGPAASACAHRPQGSPLRSDPAAGGFGLDAKFAHARPDWPLDDDALSDAPSRKSAGRIRGAEVVPDACAVRFALVQSGEFYYRKALLVRSLHELRATLDQYRTQRNPRRQPAREHVDPSDQSRRVERDEDTGAHETGAIPPTRQIPTTPAHPTRATGQMTAGQSDQDSDRPRPAWLRVPRVQDQAR